VKLVLLAPLRIEALAVRSALPGIKVKRTGMGPRAGDVDIGDADAVGVAGLCGAVDPDLRAGDIVLATELRSEETGTIPCPGSALLLDPLRRLGFSAKQGPVYCSPGVLSREERLALRPTGVVAVEMESAWIARAAGDRPLAVLRVVVDTADRRLVSPRTILAGLRGLWTLRRAGAAFVDWVETCSAANLGPMLASEAY
jgi:4-hydroxy-3-methylbut-2-en-1-yl diphosphate reductase